MTTAKYLITDTADERWAIWSGDPAHPLLDALVKVGWDKQLVRLPANVVRTGVVVEADTVNAGLNLEDATDAYEDWPYETTLLILVEAFNAYKQLDYLWNLSANTSESGQSLQSPTS